MEKINQMVFGMTNQVMNGLYKDQVRDALKTACAEIDTYNVCPERSRKRHSIKCSIVCDIFNNCFSVAECWEHYFMEDC